MKRQERLSMFFEREEALLNQILPDISGYAGLYFGARSAPNFKTMKLPHFFKASSREMPDVDAVFNDEEWPLPADFFDLVVLDHPLDIGFNFEALLQEAVRTLRKDGTLIITGFNKTRLCSWPVQNTFGKQVSCPIKRYSSLQILSLLDTAGFNSDVRYFDFCRFRFWNVVFAKVVPFLGIGFIIIAKRNVINLKPLEELNWNFSPENILKPISSATPEYYDKNKAHDED